MTVLDAELYRSRNVGRFGNYPGDPGSITADHKVVDGYWRFFIPGAGEGVPTITEPVDGVIH
jgi:hypothetical protein